MEKKKSGSTKGFSKKGSSVKNNPMAQDKKKRYSKSKFRKEVNEQMEETKTERKQTISVTKAPKYSLVEEMQIKFREKDVRESWYGVLLKDTLQRRGYSVIPRGNCVKVESFNDSPYLRFTTTDGRVGVDYGGTVTSGMFGR